MDCAKCGATNLSQGVAFCEYCGASTSVLPVAQPQSLPTATTNTSQAEVIPTLSQIDVSGLAPYFVDVFRQIEAGGGKPIAKWKWWPFWLGPFWYLYHGMWAKGLIILALAIFTNGASGLFTAIYTGILGNYDFYLLKVRKTQLW